MMKDAQLEMKVLYSLLLMLPIAIGFVLDSHQTEIICDAETEFACHGGECIPSSWQCDGQVDCLDRSDEVDCPETECSSDEFKCHDNQCILQHWVCDGSDDCTDGSDEINSTCTGPTTSPPPPSCDEGLFACPTGAVRCIPTRWVCDGEADCASGGEDELGCPVPSCDENLNFQCVSDYRCLPKRWACDGDSDCVDGSDEEEIMCESALHTCRNDERTCDNGMCITQQWWCDGIAECTDMSDEADCDDIEPKMCRPEEFYCSVGNNCINRRWVCDGEKDCDSGADEKDCLDVTCAATQFQCATTQDQPIPRCILRMWACDGEDDCGDNSDEDPEVCQDEQPTERPVCNSRERMCYNGDCIHASWWCDSEMDCMDGEDEGNCGNETCPRESFTCDSGTCVPSAARCDGVQDCADNSDESVCQYASCDLPDFFQCPNNRFCLSIAKVCDGIDDCSNGEDETECTVQTCDDENGGCEDRQCLTVPNGFFCECGEGYQFTIYGCSDVDECALIPNPCPGLDCTNQQPGFTCVCPNSNYYLEADGRTCKSVSPEPPRLLLAVRDTVLVLNVSSRHKSPAADDFESAISLGYDPDTGAVYVGDVTALKIKRFILAEDGIARVESIADAGTPDGMAFDWIYKNLYWTDTDSNTISVGSGEGDTLSVKVLIDEGLDEPRAIAVDPREGYMYWGDWGEEPYIGRAGLDGHSPVRLITDNIGWVNGLALDYEDGRMYFADAKLDRLESADLNGQNRRVVRSSPDDGDDVKHPFGVAVYQDTLYWTDWLSNAVYSVNKFSGQGLERPFDGFTNPMSLVATQGYYEDVSLCEEAGNPCSHLCLRSPSTDEGFACACPNRTILAADKRTCLCSNDLRLSDNGNACLKENRCFATPEPCPGIDCVDTHSGPTCACPEEYVLAEESTGPTCHFAFPTPPHLLVADGQAVRRIYTLFGTTETVLGRLVNAAVLAYDGFPGSEAVYISDKGSITRIVYAGPGEGNTSLIASGTGSVFGLAFDAVHRNLYWTDSLKSTINVATWDGGYSKVLMTRLEGINTPKALAVDPENGYMYWSSFSPRFAHISRAGLDGSNPEQIVSESLQRPASLALDPSQGKIYWVDVGHQTIESAKTDGSKRRVVMRDISRRPFGIAVYQDRVYWGDVAKASVFSANKFTGSDLEVVAKGLRRPMGLAIAAPSNVFPTACEEPGRGCSHFCLGAPTPDGYTCACPGDNTRLTSSTGRSAYVCLCANGSLLHPDGQQCQNPGGDCERDEFQCKSDSRCIPLDRTCDGQNHCVDGSDEECDGGCGDWGYQCKSGDCIPLYQRCDGVPGDCRFGNGYEDEVECELYADWCSETAPVPCPGVECVNLLSGPQCVCPDTYVLETDGRTCSVAYATRPRVLIAKQNDILSFDPLLENLRSIKDDLVNAVGVVYDFSAQYMFVADLDRHSLERFSTTGGFFGQDISISDKTVLSENASSVEGIAYDWIHRNLYWVNVNDRSILAIPFDGRFPSSLVLGGLGKLRDVAVDPKEMFMYWTDWGDAPMIGKAGLDGSRPTHLVDTNIICPNGVALDYEARRVYWGDCTLDRIEYIGFDGDGRRIVIQGNILMRHPFGIAIHEDQMFWGDWVSRSLIYANKFTGEVAKVVPLNGQPMFISIARQYLRGFETVANRCEGEHGCSHLCLPSPSSQSNHTCACPLPAHLDTDGQTCLCPDGARLLRDGTSCEKKPIIEDPRLPVQVRGLTIAYFADHGPKFDMRCEANEEEGVVCTPRGAKEATVSDPAGQYECSAPRN